jgi:glycosyltransferase involved in cell wall biosynthesis
MTRIAHLIPYDGIGGVETAARSIGCVKRGEMRFEVDFIFQNIHSRRTKYRFNPIPLLAAAWKYAKGDVDLLIVSLWRAYIVGVIAKLLRPELKMVVFIHLTHDVHWLDRHSTRWAASLADEIWADSEATMSNRLKGLPFKKHRVISFVTRRFEAPPPQAVEPSFIFWGRLNSQKGIERAIRIFASICKKRPSARFRLIGPDGGSLASLKALAVSLGLKDEIDFLGPATHEEIIDLARHASFYLQTSEYEGMAMSVVESMQLGLVPVVTPVGEIASYCRHNYNAVFVKSDQQVIEDVMQLLDSACKYHTLRSNAIATWTNHPLYRDCVLNACEALLDSDASPSEELC